MEYLRKKEIDNPLGSLNAFLKKADEPTLVEASAEINFLSHMGIAKDDRVVFLSSDTDEGEMAANSLARKLENIKKIAHALHGKAAKLVYQSPAAGDVTVFDHSPY
ncbi:MAG: hypothetical protein HZA01_08720 [Nitrospinae bacterium]|nr:hypothetical protein [Nitrospinota bacterium]